MEEFLPVYEVGAIRKGAMVMGSGPPPAYEQNPSGTHTANVAPAENDQTGAVLTLGVQVCACAFVETHWCACTAVKTHWRARAVAGRLRFPRFV